MLDIKFPTPPASPSLISLNGFCGRKSPCFLSLLSLFWIGVWATSTFLAWCQCTLSACCYSGPVKHSYAGLFQFPLCCQQCVGPRLRWHVQAEGGPIICVRSPFSFLFLVFRLLRRNLPHLFTLMAMLEMWLLKSICQNRVYCCKYGEREREREM